MADPTSSAPTCDVEEPCYCPLTEIMDVLSRKYAMQLVSVVDAHGTVRFAEIEEHLPTASSSTISARLEEFEDAGILTRTQYDEIPPRVEYELTERGGELGDRLEPLLAWVADEADADD